MAANPLRGEVELVAGGTSHVLRLGVTSMILLEKEFGASLPQIMQQHFGDPKNILVSDMHKLVWAAMQRKDHTPSKEEVGFIMDEVDLQYVGGVVGELLSATFRSEGGGEENPPTASPGSTGTN